MMTSRTAKTSAALCVVALLVVGASAEGALAPAEVAKNATTPSSSAPAPHYSASLGYICAAVSIFGFGSNFVPVKRFETGDGIFFQWVLCLAIWCVGLVVYAIQGFPTFQPGAMLGGAIWATGNIMCVPIIKILGLSLGLLIWGQTNMLIGWATGYFGLFGVVSQAHLTKNHGLNFLGVGLAIVALSLYIFIEPPKDEDATQEDSNYAAADQESDTGHHGSFTVGKDYAMSSGASGKGLGQSLLKNSKPYSSLPPRNRANERLIQHARHKDFAGISATPRLLGHQTYAPVASAQRTRQTKASRLLTKA